VDAVHVQDLDFAWEGGDFALRVAELRLAVGQPVAFIGPSGSGKTTLLHLLAGIVLPRAGRVVTGGVEVTALDDAARRAFRIRSVGLVFQELELLEYLSVLDNVLLPYRMHPGLRLGSAVRERAHTLARRVGIAERLARLPGRLSQGERQRVALCRALLPEPPLLLADEPTGNLDPANKWRVLDTLLEEAQKHRATLVTVTHDHELLDRFERVIDFSDFHARPGGTVEPDRGASR
jgi:ABC-type lipoprotein export system ATPase subunit